MNDEERVLCTLCNEVWQLDEVNEVEVTPSHFRLECPNCDATKFRPVDVEDRPSGQTMDQVREQKRQQMIRSLGKK